MEFVLWILSTCLVGIAIMHVTTTELRNERTASRAQGPSVVAYDTKVMLFMGSLSTVYWSHSPPAVWAHEPLWLQWLAWLTVHGYPFITGWFLIVAQTRKQLRGRSIFMSWKVLTPLVMVVGVVVPMWNRDPSPDAWPFAEAVMVFNMGIEALAIIPQLGLISNYEDLQLATECANFVFLLCAARCVRMTFWLLLVYVEGVYAIVNSHLISYVLPDVLHTLLMGDFMIMWARRWRNESVEVGFEYMMRKKADALDL